MLVMLFWNLSKEGRRFLGPNLSSIKNMFFHQVTPYDAFHKNETIFSPTILSILYLLEILSVFCLLEELKHFSMA